MRLRDKVALVTGGTRGIGRATAELFAEEGATVYAADLSAAEPFGDVPGGGGSAGGGLAGGGSAGGSVTFVELDVTDESAWQRVVGEIVERHGRIDVLFNNAGLVGSYEPVDTIPLELWQKVLDVNLNGVFYGARTVMPVMKAAGRGSIINTSSIWGIAGAAGVAAYTASKGAVRLLSKNLALSYAGDGIRSNSLHPGIIDTPLIAAQDAEVTAGVVAATPLGRLGRAREIAYGALFLASDESSYMTGAELVIDGGYTTQ